MTEKILKLKQARAAKIAELRTILDGCTGRDLTDDEVKRYDDVEKEADHLGKEIQREERLATAEADLARSAGTFTRRAEPETKTEKEFRSFGEFLHACRFEPNDSRLEQRAMAMGTGSDGGFLVPTQFIDELLHVTPQEAIVRPRALVVPAGDNPDAEIEIPALRQGSNGVAAGVVVKWAAEAAASDETSAKIDQFSLAPKEVIAHTLVSNKLLRNASAAGVLIGEILRQAVIGSEDYAFLRGDGVGKPLGLKNSPGRISVTRNTAAKILYEDVLGLEKAMLPASQGNCVWVASQSAFLQIKDLKDSSGNRIYTDANLVKGFPATLDGIPLYFTGRVPTLGNEGDLMLVDLKYYLIKDGVGPLISMSEHFRFTNNQTVVKVVRSVDASLWVKEPLLLEDGTTEVSPCVVLK
jgi:HK97 family phage major capsid protein